MSADALRLTLPATSNNDDCQSFVAALGAAKGSDIEVDASQCKQLTARFAQLLVLASKTWTAESLNLQIVMPSDAFLTTLKRLGLHDVFFAESEAQ